MRCGRCGNDNAETNRFCGMCGAPLLSKPDAAQAPPSPASSNPAADLRPTPAPAPRTAPAATTGPSFLGLSKPGPAREVPPSDHGDPPANLDYLLENNDEEEPKRGPGKLILVLVALALAIGFGYLHWKQGGFDWLNASKKPATSAPDAAPPANSSASSSAPNAAPPNPVASDASTPPAAALPTPSQTTPSNNAAPDNATPSAANPAAPSQPNDSAAPPATAESDQSPVVPTAAAPLPKLRKPAPTKPAVPYDPVTEAERYIYGRGARQDCDHGLRLLKPAAEQSNPKAMISMGALYSTGTCTPRDLPTAYRWFALALHKQPDNQVLQDDLKNLWEKMTQPERQLAIKLSQ